MRTSNSFLSLREASVSLSERVEVRASTSSMNTIDGLRASAASKSARTWEYRGERVGGTMSSHTLSPPQAAGLPVWATAEECGATAGSGR
eukprot:scaffold19465_cov92-Isochrysis_galbana.AAC.2